METQGIFLIWNHHNCPILPLSVLFEYLCIWPTYGSTGIINILLFQGQCTFFCILPGDSLVSFSVMIIVKHGPHDHMYSIIRHQPLFQVIMNTSPCNYVTEKKNSIMNSHEWVCHIYIISNRTHTIAVSMLRRPTNMWSYHIPVVNILHYPSKIICLIFQPITRSITSSVCKLPIFV